MKHIVSFSGGMGSFAEAYYCVQEFGKENVLLLFADTLMEDSDLYRFKDEVVAFLGCELVTLTHGQNIWELFEDKRFIGNTRADICSSILKRDLLIGYIKDNYTTTEYVPIIHKGKTLKTKSGKVHCNKKIIASCEVHLGIDFSEHHRLTRVQEYMKPIPYRSLLVERGIIVPKDFSEQFGIKRPYLYTLGFGHNNCGGMCVKAGLGQFKLFYEKLPERYLWNEEQEQKVIAVGGLPFLSLTRNGKERYLTMREFRQEFIETGNAEQYKHDIGGCACALPLPVGG